MTGWTRLWLIMYICAILNYCYAFYSHIQMDFINTIISTATSHLGHSGRETE